MFLEEQRSHRLRHKLAEPWRVGIVFSTKILLRLAIIFYGFRLTFQDIEHVGLNPTYLASILFLWLMFGEIGIVLGATGL